MTTRRRAALAALVVALVVAAFLLARAGNVTAPARTPDTPAGAPPAARIEARPPAEVPQSPTVAAPGPSITILLEVRSMTDAPVAGARVELRMDLDERSAEIATHTTDARGRWNVAAPAAHDWRFRARADGYADGTVVVHAAAGPAERRVILRLERGFELTGFVRDEAGSPVAAAVVQIAGRRAVADAAGAYSLTGLPAGELRPTVRAAGKILPKSGVVSVPDVATLDFRLVAIETRTAAGVVKDDATGASISGAVVRPAVNGHEDLPSSTTDADGRFRIEGLWKTFGDDALVVSKAGYVSDPAQRVAVADGVELRLRRGATVVGVVSSPDGPVADAEVVLASPDPALGGVARRTTHTDAAGRFSFDATPAGRSELVVSAAGFIAPPFRPIDAPETGEVNADVSLTRGAVLEGRVIDDSGAPVDEAYVAAHDRRAWTDGAGTFRLDGVKPGSTSLLVMAADHARTERAIDVAPGRNADVVLQIARTATVRGRLVAADGRPVEDARVFVVAVRRAEAGPMHDFMRDGGEDRAGPFPVLPDGTFVARLPATPVDVFRVLVRTTSHAVAVSDAVGFVPGQAEYRADVTLSPGFVIRGVATCGGVGVAGALVTLGRAGYGYSEPPVRAVTDSAGRFSIPHVVLPPSGKAHVAASAPGCADAEAEAAGDVEVELVLERGLEIAGVVETADRAPAARVHVAVEAMNAAGGVPVVRFAFSDEAGRFRIGGLRPGKYRVTATLGTPTALADPVRAGATDLVVTLGR